ncbi:MAG: APC family permease [Gemmatimonadaceae bacterium]
MTTPSVRDSGALPRRIGFWSAVAIVVGSTIGSGIFRTPASVADRIPGPLPLIAVWVVAGIFALCGALTLAEVASILPRTGGFYAFLRDGWSRLLGFLFGWSQLVMVRAFALGAIAITFSEYFLRVLGYDPTVAPYDRIAHYVAAVAIVLTASFNIVGVRWGALVTNITTIGKFAGLSFVIVLALLIGLPNTGGHFTPATPPGSFAVGAFGLALVSCLWAYDGWGDLSYVAGEVQEPQRNLPRALIGGTLAVIGIYVLANLAYLAVLPVEQIRTSKLVAADVAQAVIGRPGAVLVSLTVMISTFGTLSAVLLTTPRILFAMADDGLLFRPIAKVHPRYETPYMAIGLVAALGAVFVLFFPFEQLADAFVTAMIPFYALGVAAVFPLRRRGAVSPYRTPGYPIVPLLFIASVAYLMINGLIAPEARTATVVIFAVILAGIPVYYMIDRRRHRERTAGV